MLGEFNEAGKPKSSIANKIQWFYRTNASALSTVFEAVRQTLHTHKHTHRKHTQKKLMNLFFTLKLVMTSNITRFHRHYLFMFLPTFLWVTLLNDKNILTYLYSTVQLFSEHQVRTSILPTFFSDAWYNKTIKRDSIKICRFSNYIFVITS